MADPLSTRTEAPAPGCLDAQVAEDFREGRLTPEQRERVERHLAGCARCRLLVETSAPTVAPLADGPPAAEAPADEAVDTVAPESVSGERAPPLDKTVQARAKKIAGSDGLTYGRTVASGEKPIPEPWTPRGEVLASGDQVGRYRVERVLGAGGMGRVLLAYDPELDRRVAIKLLRAQDSADWGLEARLLREAQAMARVSHPNVVAVHDVGAWNGQVFVAMEYVPGGTLSEWLAEKRSVRQVMDVFRQAGAGLAAAHRAGLIHRDFKPDNVLLGKDGQVRVTDFGLARAMSAAPEAPVERTGLQPLLDQSMTQVGSVMGTPAYMSPEQHEGRATDARTDQFAFCVALYQALYGYKPFGGDTLETLRETITRGQLRPPPPDARVPGWLRDAVLRGLRTDPAERFPSLEPLVELLSRDPEVGDGLSGEERGRPRLRGALLGGLATALVMALAPTQAWRSFEERAQGLLLTARPRAWNPDIVLLEIDQATINALGWPIPRRVHARVLEAITQVGVRAVSYDVFFTGPARDGPEADQAFALALAKSGRAVLSMPCTSDDGGDAARVAAVVGSSLAAGEAPAPLCEGVVAPNGTLMASAAAVSQVELARSASGNVRGAYPLTEVGGRKLFSLSLATYLTGEGIAPGAIVQERTALGVGPVRVPVDGTGAALASFRIPTEEDVLSYGELVKALGSDPPTLPARYAERLRGRYVLVGQTAQSVRDVGPFANGQQLPLVLLHGALLADLLEGEPLRELSLPAQLLLVALFGALLTAAALWLRPVLLGLGLLVALWGIVGGGLLLAQAGLALGPLGPALASVLACALVASGRIATEERNRRRVKGAFHAYLNERVLARVLADPRRALPLEGARRRVTVLCASAREPASGAEQVAPEEGIARRRARLKDLVARILEQDGRVEVLRGDGVVAVFGDPIANPDHARRAVAAALAILRTVGADERGLELRIGVATGLVLAGNVSPEAGRIEYAVVGPTVDGAEALARRAPVGGMLVSLETRDDCADGFTFEPATPDDPTLPAYLARARA